MNRKPIFDAVRKMLGRGFRQSEVSALDAALDAAFADPIPVTQAGQLRVSKAGIQHIKDFEGCELTAYPDPGTGGDPWTIGWGATRINGKPVKPGMRITQDMADKILEEDVERHAVDVRDFIGTTPTTQGQFDALVGFHFNTGKLPVSTLGRKHKAGDYEGAADEFAKWKFAGGRVLKGLVRRRDAERRLYLS